MPGAITPGFGMMASVTAKNVTAPAALADGTLPFAEDRPDRSRKNDTSES
jgi:hypothetical protein